MNALEELKLFILTGQSMAEQGECLMPNSTDVLNEIERLLKEQSKQDEEPCRCNAMQPVGMTNMMRCLLCGDTWKYRELTESEKSAQSDEEEVAILTGYTTKITDVPETVKDMVVEEFNSGKPVFVKGGTKNFRKTIEECPEPKQMIPLIMPDFYSDGTIKNSKPLNQANFYVSNFPIQESRMCMICTMNLTESDCHAVVQSGEVYIDGKFYDVPKEIDEAILNRRFGSMKLTFYEKRK